jgi:hypothetical protein
MAPTHPMAPALAAKKNSLLSRGRSIHHFTHPTLEFAETNSFAPGLARPEGLMIM